MSFFPRQGGPSIPLISKEAVSYSRLNAQGSAQQQSKRGRKAMC